MLELGKIQTLQAVKKVEFGMYFAALDDKKGEERVLLPAKQVPKGMAIGDRAELFLYKDSSDRLIATTRTPMISLGKVARLKVAGTTKIGAFLDWGLRRTCCFLSASRPIVSAKGMKCWWRFILIKATVSVQP